MPQVRNELDASCMGGGCSQELPEGEGEGPRVKLETGQAEAVLEILFWTLNPVPAATIGH